MSPEVIAMREPDEPTTSERVLLSSGRYVLFGPFRIDQQRQEVTRNGARLKLQGKVYQVLLTLGDSSDKPLYIETIPRKGYCLLVQPEVSDKPAHALFAQSEASADSVKEASRSLVAPSFSKSDVWIVLGVIGLILAGMLLGAGITRLWISHAAFMAR